MMLRISISGSWEPEDFVGLLHSIESLYYKFTARREVSQAFRQPIIFVNRFNALSYDDDVDLANDWLLSHARATTRQKERLVISGITYASPGEMDFLGNGRGLEAVRGIVRDIHDYCSYRELLREQEEIKTEHMRESLRAKKMETTMKWLAFRREYLEEDGDESARLIVRDMDEIVRLSLEQKINGVSIIDDK